MHYRIKKILSFRVPALLCTILIFILMVIPGTMLPKEEHFFIPDFDKFIHAFLFGSFVFLWCVYSASRWKNQRLLYLRFFLICLIGCVYGIAMEYVQKYFIPNRDYDLYDIFADAVGAFAGFLFVSFTLSWFRSN